VAGSRTGIGLVAAALVVVAVGVTMFSRQMRGPVALASREYATAPGERETVTLPDGTEFTLAPASRLRLGPGYGATRREITLEGEAYFVVVHDPGRPFVVRAAHAITTDIGTRFDVRAYADDRDARVVVTAGAVSVASAGVGAGSGAPSEPSTPRSSRVVTRGMEVDVAPEGTLSVASGVDVDAAVGWTSGTIAFQGTALSDVVRELARWYGIDVRVGDASLAGRRITASFKDEAKDDVLRSVAAAVGATVERRGPTIVLVATAAGRGARPAPR
jgi:transmembrane sensor